MLTVHDVNTQVDYLLVRLDGLSKEEVDELASQEPKK